MLTTGSWPSSAAAPCALPAELESCTAAFEEFYKQKHSGRQLQWHPAMGTADLKATIRGKRVMLTVTTHQMVVLMLLNDQPSISFSHLLRVRSAWWQLPSSPSLRRRAPRNCLPPACSLLTHCHVNTGSAVRAALVALVSPSSFSVLSQQRTCCVACHASSG